MHLVPSQKYSYNVWRIYSAIFTFPFLKLDKYKIVLFYILTFN